MPEVTQLLNAVSHGDPRASAELLPVVYEELRKLAAQKIAQEKPGQTLQATALVHEAYLRLVGGAVEQQWAGRGHFFAAASEAMRRILVEQARHKLSQKKGGGLTAQEVNLNDLAVPCESDPLEALSVHESLERLASKSPRRAELVKLRYFLGCTVAEAAQILGIAASTAEEDWTYAKAWLRRDWLKSDLKNLPE